MAAPHSLAQKVLHLCNEIDGVLDKIRLEMAEQWPASTVALMMASAQLRTAAEIRLQRSESERSRRSTGASASVMAPRSACD